jgi:hypothetical protein
MLSSPEKAALADIYDRIKALGVALLMIGAGARLLVCDQFDDARWTQAFDTTLKRF